MQNIEKPFFPVIAAGLVTTVLTLAALHFLNMASDDFNLMSWYVKGIIPAGALLVGLIAGSGYSLASWFLGIKVNKTLVFIILGLQLVAYAVAQYIDYLDILGHLKMIAAQIPGADISHFTFFHYFDKVARSMVWASRYSHDGGTPLGAWGYAFRALEVAGFSLGGLIAPLALSSHPFCEKCQRYMRGSVLTTIAASVPAKLFQKADEQANKQAVENAMAQVANLQKLARDGNAHAFRDTLKEIKGKAKEANAAPSKYSVEMVRCPGCNDGYLRHAVITQQGRSTERKESPERIPLSADFIKTIS